MLIRTSDVWTRQPKNVLVGINAGSAFSRSLVMAFSAASKDLGQTRWSLGAGAVRPFKAGLMIGGDGGFSIQPSIPALISNSFSILALVRRVDTANSQTVISQRLAGHGLEIGTSYIDLVQWNVQNNVASGETLSGDIVVAVTRNGNAITYYANGRQYGTATASSTINSGNGELASIGSRAGSGTYYGTNASAFGNGVYCCFVWSRPLSSAEISDLSVNPWQIFAPERRTLFVSSGALPSLAVTANLASAVGSMAFKSQPTFAVSGATAAVQGLMSFGPASRLAVNATTGDTVGSMDFKAQPVFGVAATTGQTLGSMAFKAQPSLGVNAATAPAVGAMSFGAASRLSVSATLAPTVGSMAFVAQPKFAVVAQTASVQGLMSFGPSSRLTVNAVTDPTVGSMAFKSLPTLAVNAQTVPTIGSMTFAVSPRFGVLAALAPTLGNMRFISGDMPNDSPGRFDIHVSRKVTFDCTIARTVNFKVEVVNRG